MNYYLSHHPSDMASATKLASDLKGSGIGINISAVDSGRNVAQHVASVTKSADGAIILLSNAYLASRVSMQELALLSTQTLIRPQFHLATAQHEPSEIPLALESSPIIDLTQEGAVAELVDQLHDLQIDGASFGTLESTPQAPSHADTTQAKQIERLAKHLNDGSLTLVCGAGTSVAAGVPTWNSLLNELLTGMIRRDLPNGPSADDDRKKLAKLYADWFNPSPLIMAQYLKNSSGHDFVKTVRDAIYRNSPAGSDLIDAIVELCQPHGGRPRPNSIINFNFDDLIELNLHHANIMHHAVSAEGQQPHHAELPIYHVHGYLPRAVENPNSIVFSEDAYHTQFLEPFSWSNLIQVDQYSHNVCLFVGLSMSDPNLRRLLDIAQRKNPHRTSNHYVIRRRKNAKSLQDELARRGVTDASAALAHHFSRMTELVEEQDGHILGLNTIWIDSFSDIPRIIRAIANA